MSTIYFATNRMADPNMKFGFSNESLSFGRGDLIFGRAEVDNVITTDEKNISLSAVGGYSFGAFSSTIANEIVGAQKNLLVLLCGIDDSFEGAIKKGALHKDLLASRSVNAADVNVIIFSLAPIALGPALREALLGRFSNAEDFKIDESAFRITCFFRALNQLRSLYRSLNPVGRMFLLFNDTWGPALAQAMQICSGFMMPLDVMFDGLIAYQGESIDTCDSPSDGATIGQHFKRLESCISRECTTSFSREVLDRVRKAGVLDGLEYLRRNV